MAGQFLGQFIGEGLRNAGNRCGLALEFKGRFPEFTRLDVIIKCRVYLRGVLRSTFSRLRVRGGRLRTSQWNGTSDLNRL